MITHDRCTISVDKLPIGAILTRMRVGLIIAMVQMAACLSALAQQTPPAFSSWNHVQQLPIHSKIRIKSDQKMLICLIDSVNEDQVVCSRSQAANSRHYEIRRAEIRNIKLSRRSHSAVLGLALGAAVGAGAGAGIGTAINSSDTGSLFHNTGSKAAGVGAAVGVLLVSPVGALIAYSGDFFAGPLVYQR